MAKTRVPGPSGKTTGTPTIKRAPAVKKNPPGRGNGGALKVPAPRTVAPAEKPSKVTLKVPGRPDEELDNIQGGPDRDIPGASGK